MEWCHCTVCECEAVCCEWPSTSTFFLLFHIFNVDDDEELLISYASIYADWEECAEQTELQKKNICILLSVKL